MKVLVIAPFPPYKAPEADHAFGLCEQLADQGLDVDVITQQGSVASRHPRVTVHPIMRKWSWSELPRLARTMRRCSPDAVLLFFLYWAYDHPMITFVPTVAKRLLPRAQFVTLFEEAEADSSRTPFLARAVRKVMKLWAGSKDVDYGLGTLLRDSDCCIVVSDLIRAALEKCSPNLNGKAVLIPAPSLLRICPDGNGMARQRKRECLGVAPDDYLLAYFGYIYRGKGLETLLKAFLAVTKKRSNVRLIMVGGTATAVGSPAYAQGLREMTSQMGLDDKVTWIGGYEWDSEEPSHCLHAADICVLPFDGGVSIHNSSFAGVAAHGLPTITTRGAVLDEPFVHEENVYLCPPRDCEAMAAAIELLLEKPELRDHLSTGILSFADEWFSWKRATERTMATLSRNLRDLVDQEWPVYQKLR
jgi:glycosyltransferase involved in cell wall biosynthesis